MVYAIRTVYTSRTEHAFRRVEQENKLVACRNLTCACTKNVLRTYCCRMVREVRGALISAGQIFDLDSVVETGTAAGKVDSDAGAGRKRLNGRRDGSSVGIRN